MRRAHTDPGGPALDSCWRGSNSWPAIVNWQTTEEDILLLVDVVRGLIATTAV
jgi:hypothetical protein